MREMKRYQITEWCHHFMENHVKEGDLCIDAVSYTHLDVYKRQQENMVVMESDFLLLRRLWNRSIMSME